MTIKFTLLNLNVYHQQVVVGFRDKLYLQMYKLMLFCPLYPSSVGQYTLRKGTIIIFSSASILLEHW